MATVQIKEKEVISFTHALKMDNLSEIYSELESLEKDITESGITKIMTHFRKTAVNKSKTGTFSSADYIVLATFVEERETSFNNSEFVQACIGIPEIKHQVINAILKILEGSHLVKFINCVGDEFDEEGQSMLISSNNDKAKSIYISRYQFSQEPEADFLCNASEKLVQQYLDLYTVDSVNETIVREMGIFLDCNL